MQEKLPSPLQLSLNFLGCWGMVYLGNEFRQASYELDRLLRLPREISPTDADWLCLEEKIAQYAKWQPEEADRVRDILSKQWGRQSVREAA